MIELFIIWLVANEMVQPRVWLIRHGKIEAKKVQKARDNAWRFLEGLDQVDPTAGTNDPYNP